MECAGCRARKASLIVRQIKEKVGLTKNPIVYPSGMVRSDPTGKINYLLIRSGPMFERWAWHMTKGELGNNWLKASGPEELEHFRASAGRHFEQWLRGENDEDHAASLFFNVNGVEYILEKRRRETL